jgi:phage tail sheath protein FI
MADVDNRKYPWYAPAGIERGNVECNKARIFTKLSDENTIYDGRINPVKTFSVAGVKIWGNKTIYTGDTPMNRINTVRLVLYMRKLISQSITSLIFEPNDTTLKAQFEGIVNPILQQIKDDRGITDFRLVVSQTPEQMDEHEISAQLWIKPTPTLEYIELDFIVTPQGVDWNE